MKKINNLILLKREAQKKMIEDSLLIMRTAEVRLYNMLNNVIQERVYNAYNPVKYKRTYQLKNAITRDIGYEESDKQNRSRIVSRVYIDERKMNYENNAKNIPRRVDDNRVRRREDRWTNSIRSSHFFSPAYKEYVDIASSVERDLLLRGYIKK